MTANNALTESEYTYDQKFKQLFQNKKFLAPILKNIVKEYRDISLPEIESLIISVSGDEETAASIGTEDVGKGNEMKTCYDVLAGCRMPDSEDLFTAGLYFDLEMQREKNTGYPVPARGIYYCSRLISRQLTSLEGEAYTYLKPVYSVWIIINDIPQTLRYSRYEVSLNGVSSIMEESRSFSKNKRKRFHAAVRKLDSQIDYIHLCLVFLSEDFTDQGESGDALIRYLQSVFMKKIADSEYNPYADYSKSIKKEADKLMTIVEMFEERAERRGRKIGEKRGEDRLKELLCCLKQQHRDEDINQILFSENRHLLEKLYSEFHL